MIGVVSALDSEMALLRSRLTDERVEVHASAEYHLGKIAGVDVVLVICGVGKVNAAMHTQALIDFYHPSAILQSGVAGALAAELKLFDLVIGSELTYHDMQDFVIETFDPLEKYYYADPRLVSLAESVAKEAHTGRIASGDLFVSDKETKHAIAARTSALCVEMEGAAVAHTARLNDVPFLTIRVMSDSAEEAPEMSFAAFEKEAAQLSGKMVLDMLPHVENALRNR